MKILSLAVIPGVASLSPIAAEDASLLAKLAQENSLAVEARKGEQFTLDGHVAGTEWLLAQNPEIGFPIAEVRRCGFCRWHRLKARKSRSTTRSTIPPSGSFPSRGRDAGHGETVERDCGTSLTADVWRATVRRV